MPDQDGAHVPKLRYVNGNKQNKEFSKWNVLKNGGGKRNPIHLFSIHVENK
jgi:hypothetical protein